MTEHADASLWLKVCVCVCSALVRVKGRLRRSCRYVIKENHKGRDVEDVLDAGVRNVYSLIKRLGIQDYRKSNARRGHT